MTTRAQKVAEFPPETENSKIVRALNERNSALPQVWQTVSTMTAREYLFATNGQWGNLKDARAAADIPVAARKAADKLLDLVNMQDQIDFTKTSLRSAVQAAISVLTQAASEGFMSLGRRNQSWAEAFGVEVTLRTVSAVRGTPE